MASWRVHLSRSMQSVKACGDSRMVLLVHSSNSLGTSMTIHHPRQTDAIQCLIQRWGARPLAQRHWLLPKRSKRRAKIGFSSRVAKEGKSHQVVVWTGAGLSWKFIEIVVYDGNTGNQGWDLEVPLSGFVMLCLSASPLISLEISTVTTKILTVIFNVFFLLRSSSSSSSSQNRTDHCHHPLLVLVSPHKCPAATRAQLCCRCHCNFCIEA